MSATGSTKKVKTVEGPSASGKFDVGHYNADTINALEEIDACQRKIDALTKKASEEILKVDQKYSELRKPYFEKRKDVIKRVPTFWGTAFMNHPEISAILLEEEEDILLYLSDLKVEEFGEHTSDHRITFRFNKNPYFENDILIKEYHSNSSGEPKSQSTTIRWKEGNDITKKGKDKNTGKGKKRAIEQKSFFNWFSDNDDPSSDDIGDVIKDDMWPNPLQYYLVSYIEADNNLKDECAVESEGEGEFESEGESEDEGETEGEGESDDVIEGDGEGEEETDSDDSGDSLEIEEEVEGA